MARKNENGLTDKQQTCADLYLADPERNGTKAYKGAYPKCKKDNAAKVNFSKLLTNANFSTFIDKRMGKIAEKLNITQESLIQDLETIKDRCMQAEAVTDGKGNKTGEYVFKENGALNAIKMIGQHTYDMWNTKKLVGDPDKPIEHVHTHVTDEIGAELGAFYSSKGKSSGKAKSVH